MRSLIRLVAATALSLTFAACASEPAKESPKEPAKESARESAGESAGDPLKTLPDNYKLQFENDYVKVVRVHYDAGAKLPEHIHPAGSTAYVYLNDNDAVLFNHAGAGERPGGRPLERPPVKAGGARFATSHEEHHTVENISSTPTDFVRIWYKTDNAGLTNNVRRRIPLSEQEFSNKQTRITRPAFEAGKPLVLAPSDFPSLVVAWPSGKLQWVEAKATAAVPTDGPDTLGFVRIEFLTAPSK